MKIFRKVHGIAALLLLGMTCPHAAHADIVLMLTPAALPGMAGSTLHFTGMISNTSTTDTVFLNGDSLVFNAPVTGLTLDDTPFLTNAPASLTPAGTAGSAYSGGLFDVGITNSAVADTYFGTFTLTGGTGDTMQNTLASQGFSVTVQPAPEPSQAATLSLIAAGLLGLALRAHRRRTASVL